MKTVFGIGGIAINKKSMNTIHPEFKRSSDRNEDFLRAKEDEANKQHKNIIEALKAAAPWVVWG